MARMSPIGEIRRKNLETLIREFLTMEALAEKASTTSVYLSQIRNRAIDSKTGRPREMGTSMARRLEEAASKPRGWMDAEYHHVDAIMDLQGVPPPPPPDFSDRHEITQSEWQLLQDLRAVHEDDKAAIAAELRAKAEKYRAVTAEILGKLNGPRSKT